MCPILALSVRSTITIYKPVVLEKVYGFRARGLLVESWSPDRGVSTCKTWRHDGPAVA